MGFDSPSHWAILAVIVLVLFGYKKLPEMSRSVGRSLRIFKTEMKGMNDDDSARDGTGPRAPEAAAPAIPPVPVNPPVPPAETAPAAPAPPVAQTPSAPPVPADDAPWEAPR